MLSVIFDEAGFWSVEFGNITAMAQFPFRISGNDEILFGCSIEDSVYAINTRKIPSNLAYTPTEISEIPSSFKLWVDKCSPNLIFYSLSYESSSALYFTQVGDLTVKNSLIGFQSAPLAISSTMSSVCLLVEGSISCFESDREYKTNVLPSISAIRSVDFCAYSNITYSSKNNAIVAAWSESFTSTDDLSSLILISYNSGATFQPIASFLPSFAGKICDILIQTSLSNIAILLWSGNSLRVLLYNVHTQTYHPYSLVQTASWQTVSNAAAYLASGGIRGSELLLWGQSISYSPNGGLTFFDLRFENRNRSTNTLLPGEYIFKLVVDANGRIAALTSKKRLFVGQTGIPTMIEIVSGVDDISNGVVRINPVDLSFDSVGRLAIYSLVSLQIDVRYVPVDNEIKSPRLPIAPKPLACKYSSFETSADLEYLLDKGDSVVFETNLIPFSSNSSKISVSTYANYQISYSNVSQSSFIKVNSSEYVARDMHGNFVKAFKATINATAGSSTESGRVDIMLQPHAQSLACKSKFTTTLNVGCPPSRRVKIATIKNSITNRPGTIQDCQNAAGTQFTIPGSQNSKGVDITASSMCDTLSSIETAYYSSTWRPQLDLYDGDVYIKTIDSDFAISEV